MVPSPTEELFFPAEQEEQQGRDVQHSECVSRG